MGKKQREMSSSAPRLIHCPCDSCVSSPSPVLRPCPAFCVISQTHVSPHSPIVPDISVTPLYLLPLLFTSPQRPPPTPSLASALPLPFSLHLVSGLRGPTLTSPLPSTGHLPQLCPFRVPDLSPSSSLWLSLHQPCPPLLSP